MVSTPIAGNRHLTRTASYRIGLISDTHGLLRPEALAWLRGSDAIVHAGDIGDPGVIEALAAIAPVTAVRGNNDTATWAAKIPETNALDIGDVGIYVIHAIQELDLDPAAAGFRVVVAGHSHRPAYRLEDGIWFVNPGSAGPRRFSLPISAGELVILGGEITPRLVELSPAGPVPLESPPY